MTPGERYRVCLDWFARVGALLVTSVGAAVIIGWVLNIALLKTLMPGLASMKLNTACAFLTAGVALWCVHTSAPQSQLLRLGRAFSFIVAALGGFTLAQDFFSIDLGIDQFLMRETPVATNISHPGRMAPTTALCFFATGVALLTLKARQPRLAVCSHWVVVAPIAVSTLAILGYVYGVSALYEIKPFTTMAVHTALSFLVLALSLLAADSAHGFASIATSDTAGGIVSRRLLPTIPVVLIALGWARLVGQHAGMYGTEFGLALMVLFSILICVGAVAATATTLHKVDGVRKQAEAEITGLNANLEQQVQERTEQLAELSAALSANKALEQLSQQDGLTNLANRRFFDTYLAGQIAVGRRHKRTLAFVLYDVDAFKAYNDHYGHQAGDDCLKQIASVIRSCCRRPADMAARYGGEEFAMILPDTDLTGAMLIAEAARNAVALLRILHAHSAAGPYISISGGVAVVLGNSTAEQLIRVADQNLYQAKHQGRNRIVSAHAVAA